MEKYEANQQRSLKKFEHNHTEPQSVILATGQQSTEKEIEKPIYVKNKR
jgi:hypothetical protein